MKRRKQKYVFEHRKIETVMGLCEVGLTDGV